MTATASTQRAMRCVSGRRQYHHRPWVSVILFLLVCTIACEGIGGWRKSTPTETEDSSSNHQNHSNNNHSHHDNNNEDWNKTYLDLFGETAKEFLTQKAPERLRSLVPAADDACAWDWRYFRCEPYCACAFQPKLPWDFHLGRACRTRDNHPFESSRMGEGSEAAPSETTPLPPAIERKFDALYRDYCLSPGADRDSPPPLKIPTPFPVLVRGGKALGKIVQSKADPVVAGASRKLGRVHERVQAVVCQDLRRRCEGSAASDEPPVVAWQERLVCGDVVRDCTTTES